MAPRVSQQIQNKKVNTSTLKQIKKNKQPIQTTPALIGPEISEETLIEITNKENILRRVGISILAPCLRNFLIRASVAANNSDIDTHT
jgi:hypothetical protein